MIVALWLIMEITLYKNYSAFNRLDKDIRQPITRTVTAKGILSHENPTFILSRGENEYYNGYNFLYCRELNAFYNAKLTILQGGMIQIDCNIDPSTFKNDIRGLICFVERQENVYNPYFNDTMLPIAQGSIIDTIDVGQVGENANVRHTYLTCVGGIETT